MKLALFLLLALSAVAFADIPLVPDSVSPDGTIQAVMDIDRDPTISPALKGDSVPRIELTEMATGRVLASIEYFGSEGDDARPLREHVQVRWRHDSKACAITIQDRFYSSSQVFALNKESRFVKVEFPTYEEMTGFPVPDRDQLRPRGQSSVEGWDSDGKLIYYIFLSPLPSYSGDDPLEHTVLLNVTPERMVPANKPLE